MGRLRQQDAVQEFRSQFDRVAIDGYVAQREFFEYYASVSAAIKDDVVFEKVIQNSWPSPSAAPSALSGGYQSGGSGRTSNVLVTYNNGTKGVVRLERDLGKEIYHEDTVKRQLRKQGIKGVVECVPTG